METELKISIKKKKEKGVKEKQKGIEVNHEIYLRNLLERE